MFSLLKKLEPSPLLSSRRLMFLCLGFAGLIELVMLGLSSMFNFLAFSFCNTYMVLPALIFAGCLFTTPLSSREKRYIFLSLGYAAWFLISWQLQRFNGMGPRRPDLPLCIYLMAFPFAFLTKDGQKQRGLAYIYTIFALAAAWICVLTGLLLLDAVPEMLDPYVYWDGARLLVLRHPNHISAILMMGIMMSLGVFFTAKKPAFRLCALIFALVQLLIQPLAHSRTSGPVTCAMVAAAVFFAYKKKGWKQILLWGCIALLILGVLLGMFEGLYQINENRLVQTYTEEVQQNATVDTPLIVDQQTGEVSLKSGSGQPSLLEAVPSFNGRTIIWSGCIQALRETPTLALFGTSYVPLILQIYSPRLPMGHAHNSWFEVTLHAGLPALGFALMFTCLALWVGLYLIFTPKSTMWQKCVSMMVLGILAAGFTEPLLFSAIDEFHMYDFIFFMSLGYLCVWYEALRHPAQPEG